MASQIIAMKQRGHLCRKARVHVSAKFSSKELLQLCLKKDAGAWYDFVHRFQPLLAAVILKTLRRCINPSPSLVDDLVQETYLKLCANDFKALRDFDCRHEYALEGFLKVVASNVVQDYFRSLWSQKHGSGKAEDDIEKAIPKAGSTAGSVAVLEQAVILGQIEQCLQRQCSEPNLERDRKIFELYYRRGLTADAISHYPGIGLTVKGVESALFRLTELLRAKINRPWCRVQSPARECM